MREAKEGGRQRHCEREKYIVQDVFVSSSPRWTRLRVAFHVIFNICVCETLVLRQVNDLFERINSLVAVARVDEAPWSER